jgi:hypothetical protein
LRAVGEKRGSSDPEVTAFLESLGLVASTGQLTAVGHTFFRLRFIDEDMGAATEMLRHQILTACPEAGVICQLLANRPKVARQVGETVLRSQGHGNGLTDRKLGALLALMSRAGVIEYSKREGSFQVLAKPLTEPELPGSIFISPETPASNRLWLRRVLSECDEFIYWLDKHFLPEGLEFITEAVDGARVRDVRIISLALPESQTRRAKRARRDVARELRGRGASFEWRFADSGALRDTHDRWIVTWERCWNLPNLNAILSGQRSEIAASDNAAELKEMFETAWTEAERQPDSADA